MLDPVDILQSFPISLFTGLELAFLCERRLMFEINNSRTKGRHKKTIISQLLRASHVLLCEPLLLFLSQLPFIVMSTVVIRPCIFWIDIKLTLRFLDVDGFNGAHARFRAVYF